MQNLYLDSFQTVILTTILRDHYDSMLFQKSSWIFCWKHPQSLLEEVAYPGYVEEPQASLHPTSNSHYLQINRIPKLTVFHYMLNFKLISHPGGVKTGLCPSTWQPQTSVLKIFPDFPLTKEKLPWLIIKKNCNKQFLWVILDSLCKLPFWPFIYSS